jgi:hypothetical protein
VWQPDEIAMQPYFSFRVWSGVPLPERYTATIAVRPIRSPNFRPPVGEISLIPHYVDPTHYVEVVVEAGQIGIWVADGAQPGSELGWRGVRFLAVTTAAGETRMVTMAVDRSQSTLTVSAGGQSSTITESILATQPAGIALRAVGNEFAVPTFRIEALP